MFYGTRIPAAAGEEGTISIWFNTQKMNSSAPVSLTRIPICTQAWLVQP